MSNGNLNWIANFIWGIADDVLRDVYVRGKYRDVILPMVVIRRLDAVLEPTKQAVVGMKKNLDKAKVANQDAALRQTAKQAFYNTSPFTLRDLKARAKAHQLKADFEAYLDGFSPNVQEILDKFKFRNQIPTLVEADILGSLIEKFLEHSVNLGPQPVLNEDGSERLPALDNHAMGTIFEELIRRFNEENNEEAGEHFTPRDVVKLMADLIFLPIADQIESGTYLVYDGACGTGGMLTVAEDRLSQLAGEHDKEVSIHLYGQEVNPETYAITKADLLLKGEGEEAENFQLGSTLSQDGFPSREFDFMLSPPYGKSWKTDLERMGGKGDIRDPRFIIEHDGDPEFSLNGGVGGYEREGIQGGSITDNAPLRGGKGMLYEGGIRVPYIFRWPGKIAPGATCDELIHNVDLYPTLLELAGVPRPEHYTLDGTSYLDLLTKGGKADHPRPPLFQHFPGYLGSGGGTWRTAPGGVIRDGDWKLLEFFEDGRLELYNLKNDIGEQHNLATTQPDKVKQLHSQLLAWRKTLNARMPTKNDKIDKSGRKGRRKKQKLTVEDESE